MRKLSSTERKELRNRLREHHIQRARNIARAIDMKQKRKPKSTISNAIDFILDIIEFILDILG